jgi:hypothetical protein
MRVRIWTLHGGTTGRPQLEEYYRLRRTRHGVSIFQRAARLDGPTALRCPDFTTVLGTVGASARANTPVRWEALNATARCISSVTWFDSDTAYPVNYQGTEATRPSPVLILLKSVKYIE